MEPVSADDKPSCVDYAKGDYGPTTITSESICQEACQTAEGLPIGDFNDEKVDETDPGHQKCTCLKKDNSGKVLENRGLCEDGVPNSGGPGVMDSVAKTAVTGTMIAVTAAILAASL